MCADMRIVPGGDQLRAIRVAPALVSSNGVTEVLTIVRFATLSDGAFYAPLNGCRRHENALPASQRFLEPKDQEQQQLAGRKARVQRIYIRIANARGDYLWAADCGIAAEYAHPLPALPASEGESALRRNSLRGMRSREKADLVAAVGNSGLT
jgi:hypothetical protein